MRRFPDCGENRDGWYPIRTWLGTKWIRLYESRMLNGSLLELDAEITTVFEVPLFDQPDTQTATGLKLSPQKLHATASLSYLPFHFSNTFSLQASSGIWYKVDTWMGAKWVLNPVILENVRGTPVSYLMKLTGKERVYPTPFAIPTQEEIIDPQVVQVTMEWNNRTGPATGNVWLKLELPQGERWVVPQNQIWPNYRELSESLTLPTEARSYAAARRERPVGASRARHLPGVRSLRGLGAYPHRREAGDGMGEPQTCIAGTAAGYREDG